MRASARRTLSSHLVVLQSIYVVYGLPKSIVSSAVITASAVDAYRTIYLIYTLDCRMYVIRAIY